MGGGGPGRRAPEGVGGGGPGRRAPEGVGGGGPGRRARRTKNEKRRARMN